MCDAHACLDEERLLAAREASGASLQTLGSVCALPPWSSSWCGRRSTTRAPSAFLGSFQRAPTGDR